MFYFVLQTALLLLAAYLIGAALGCMIRSLFHDIEHASKGRAAHIGAGTSATSGRSEATLRTAVSDTNVSNTGVSSEMVAGSAAAMAAATVAAAARAEKTATNTSVSNTEAKTAAQEPKPVAPPPPAPVPDAEPTGEKIKLKTSAAIAAGTAAVTGSAVAGTAAATDAAPEDLKRIEGIGPEVEEILHANNIRQYSQIANWSAADVERFSGLLNTRDRISRENWIEQAQILGKGNFTKYARRIDRGEFPVPYAYSSAGSGRGDIEPREPREPESRADKPTESLAAITASAAAAAVGGGQVQENKERALRSEREAREPRAPREAREPREPREQREPRSAQNDDNNLTSTDGRNSPLRSVRTQTRIGQQSQQAREENAARRPRLQSTRHIDDLKQIKGIGVSLEKKLNAAGITTYEQIAGWNSDDIVEISKILSFQGRVERENWIEQAQILSRGGHTEFSQRVSRGEVRSSREDETSS